MACLQLELWPSLNKIRLTDQRIEETKFWLHEKNKGFSVLPCTSSNKAFFFQMFQVQAFYSNWFGTAFPMRLHSITHTGSPSRIRLDLDRHTQKHAHKARVSPKDRHPGGYDGIGSCPFSNLWGSGLISIRSHCHLRYVCDGWLMIFIWDTLVMVGRWVLRLYACDLHSRIFHVWQLIL